MKRVLIGILLTAASVAVADQREVSEFERQAQGLGKAINSEHSAESRHCRELRQEVERLRGKPQRRATARNTYERECQRSSPPSQLQPGSIGGSPFPE